MSEEYLKKNALWLIMDPVERQFHLALTYEQYQKYIDNVELAPENTEYYADIDKDNDAIVKKIVEVLPEINHAAVSCPREYPIHPLLRHLPNLHDHDKKLDEYMSANNLNDIVYTGFHHGCCILGRTTGAVNLSETTSYTLWLKRELVGVLPTHNGRQCDVISSKYLTIF